MNTTLKPRREYYITFAVTEHETGEQVSVCVPELNTGETVALIGTVASVQPAYKYLRP